MLEMAELRYMLGEEAAGDELASRAQAWADDPNCSSQRNFDRSFSIRAHKEDFVRAGQDALQQNNA